MVKGIGIMRKLFLIVLVLFIGCFNNNEEDSYSSSNLQYSSDKIEVLSPNTSSSMGKNYSVYFDTTVFKNDVIESSSSIVLKEYIPDTIYSDSVGYIIDYFDSIIKIPEDSIIDSIIKIPEDTIIDKSSSSSYDGGSEVCILVYPAPKGCKW